MCSSDLSEDATGEYSNTLFWVLLISLMLSWVTAITLVPFFADLFFNEKDVGGKNGESEDPYSGKVFVIYRRLLDRAIHHRVITLSFMSVLLVVAVVGFGFVKQAFFPPSNTPMFLVDYWLPQGSDIRATQEAAARLEHDLLEMDSVEQVTTTIGQGAQRFMLPYMPEKSYSSYAQLIVQVSDREQIDPTLAATRELIRDRHLQAFADRKSVV